MISDGPDGIRALCNTCLEHESSSSVPGAWIECFFNRGYRGLVDLDPDLMRFGVI
jgi:hypothetical protein